MHGWIRWSCFEQVFSSTIKYDGLGRIYAQKKHDQNVEPTELIEQDENFYFIAGYTEGGFPFGTTWEEYEAEQREKSVMKKVTGRNALKKLTIKQWQLQEIVGTYGMHLEGMDSFLNIETGDVITLHTFDREEEDEELREIIEDGFNEIYFRIPERESYIGYEDMVDFTDTITDKKLQSTLIHILNGRKRIFRRFKDALSSNREQLDRYYQFVEERNCNRIAKWLEVIGVQLIIE